nr:unnamed protein product [Haemonchus contortus]
MCCALLFTKGYAEVRETLIKVINEKCASLPGKLHFNNDGYNCELEKKASEGSVSGGLGPNHLFSFDGRSTFTGYWESSLTEAVDDANKVDPVGHSLLF